MCKEFFTSKMRFVFVGADVAIRPLGGVPDGWAASIYDQHLENEDDGKRVIFIDFFLAIVII